MSTSGDVPVRFADDVKPLFRDSDRSAMSWAFDLWSYDDVSANADDDVSANADDIAAQLETGSIACDGAVAGGEGRLFRGLVGGRTPARRYRRDPTAGRGRIEHMFATDARPW